MSSFDERVRGARAKQILEDDVFLEAVSKAQTAMVEDLINIDAGDQDAPVAALRGVMRIQALYAVVQSITSIAVTGEIAAEEDAGQGLNS
jgi:uncharacterized protein (DUF1015 family)